MRDFITRRPFNTRGPREPEGFNLIRDHYWHKRVWLAEIEGRITATDTGLAWLMRVKHVGH